MGWSNKGSWRQGGWSIPAASGAPVFPSLPGMLEYWEADHGVTGNPVTAWAGVLGNYTVTNTGTVPFTATSLYNGGPAINFIASNDAALSVSGFNYSTAGDLSVFVVGRMKDASSSFGGIVAYGLVTGTGNDYNNPGASATLTRQASNAEINSTDNTGSLTSSMSVDTNHTFGIVYDSIAQTKTHYIDASAGNTVNPVVLLLTDGGTLVFGNRFLSGVVGGAGAATESEILGVYISNAAWSSGNISSWQTYISSKFGL